MTRVIKLEGSSFSSINLNQLGRIEMAILKQTIVWVENKFGEKIAEGVILFMESRVMCLWTREIPNSCRKSGIISTRWLQGRRVYISPGSNVKKESFDTWEEQLRLCIILRNGIVPGEKR